MVINKLSPEQFQKIVQWGNLGGEPVLLGSGANGHAYRFNDKVLKITKDADEAQACSIIKGKNIPNVYNVHNVGESTRINNQYYIIYTYLDPLPFELKSQIAKLDHPLSDIGFGMQGMRSFDSLKDFHSYMMDYMKDMIKAPYLNSYSYKEKLLTCLLRLNGITHTSYEFVKRIEFYNAHNKSNQLLSEISNSIKKYGPMLIQINNGLYNLQQLGIYFQDTQSNNMGMNEYGEICLMDLGVSEIHGSVPDIQTIIYEEIQSFLS